MKPRKHSLNRALRVRPLLPSRPLGPVAATWVPVFGVVTFVLLYLQAAALYPGGTALNEGVDGYSFWANYWCDLLDTVSYSGGINHGRPFALLATVLLPLSLVPLWLQLPRLFPERSLGRRIVRLAGPASMFLATLVFTPFHDQVVNLAALLGLAAFTSTIVSLAKEQRSSLVKLAWLPMGLGLLNYAMWTSGSFLWAMPTVQKLAYLSFCVWVIGASREVRRSFLRPRGNPAASPR